MQSRAGLHGRARTTELHSIRLTGGEAVEALHSELLLPFRIDLDPHAEGGPVVGGHACGARLLVSRLERDANLGDLTRVGQRDADESLARRDIFLLLV